MPVALGGACWIPVTLTISNPAAAPGSDFKGSAVVMIIDQAERQSRALEIPRGSTKRATFFLWLPPLYFTNPARVTARLEEDGEVLAEKSEDFGILARGSVQGRRIPFNSRGSAAVQMSPPWLCAYFSPEEKPEAFAPPSGETSRLRLQLYLVRLDPAMDFYDEWIGYSAFRNLVVSADALSGLGRTQIDALEAWVSAGGLLVISPGESDGYAKSRIVSHYFAVEHVDSSFRDVPSDPAYADDEEQAPAKPPSRREFIHRFKVGGLEVEAEWAAARSGLGGVLLTRSPSAAALFLDPAKSPFRTTNLTARRFFDSLLPAEAAVFELDFDAYPRAAFSYQVPRVGFMKSILDRIMDLPSIGLLGLLFVVYIACVGPVNYFVLRRKGLHAMMVVTVPAIALFFIAVIIAAGFLQKGAGAKAARTEILKLEGACSGGMRTTMVALRTTGQGEYSFRFEGGAFPIYSGPAYGLMRRIDSGDGYEAAGLALRQWDISLFKSVEPWGRGRTMRLAFAGDDSATVTNLSGMALGKGFLCSAGGIGVAEVPPLAPGETSDVRIDIMRSPLERDSWNIAHPGISAITTTIVPAFVAEDLAYFREGTDAGLEDLFRRSHFYVAPSDFRDRPPLLNGKPLSFADDGAFLIYVQ